MKPETAQLPVQESRNAVTLDLVKNTKIKSKNVRIFPEERDSL